MKTNIKITPFGGTLPKHANLERSKIQLSFLASSLFSTFSDFTHEFKLQSWTTIALNRFKITTPMQCISETFKCISEKLKSGYYPITTTTTTKSADVQTPYFKNGFIQFWRRKNSVRNASFCASTPLSNRKRVCKRGRIIKQKLARAAADK